MNRQVIRNVLFGAGLSGILISFGGAAGATAQGNGPKWKIAICHATGSATNPFVSIIVSDNGVAHRNHSADIIPAPASGCPGATATPAPTPAGGGTPTPTPIPTTGGGGTTEPTPPTGGGPIPMPTPEPVTLLLFGAGLAGIGFVKRYRSGKAKP
jgi:hypothetical protein